MELGFGSMEEQAVLLVIKNPNWGFALWEFEIIDTSAVQNNDLANDKLDFGQVGGCAFVGSEVL